MKKLEDIRTKAQAKKTLEYETATAVKTIKENKDNNFDVALKTYHAFDELIFGIARKFHINVIKYCEQVHSLIPVDY